MVRPHPPYNDPLCPYKEKCINKLAIAFFLNKCLFQISPVHINMSFFIFIIKTQPEKQIWK